MAGTGPAGIQHHQQRSCATFAFIRVQHWSGKAKMILQSVSIPAILLLLAFKGLNQTNRELVIDVIAWVTTIVTAISVLPYITKAIAASKES